MTRNVFLMIHGMTPHHQWVNHTRACDEVRVAIERQLPRVFDRYVYVIWGQAPSAGAQPDPARPDSFLRHAKKFVHDQVCHRAVRDNWQDRNNAVIDNQALIPYFEDLKEGAVLRGFTDCAYYASAGGESAIRRAAYGQFLDGLRPFLNEADVRLHVVAHSLGCTIAYDFLFGLFCQDRYYNPDPNGPVIAYRPDFLADPEVSPTHRQEFRIWRDKALGANFQERSLRLGSFSCFASQLPILIHRRPRLVESLARGRHLRTEVLGLAHDGPIQWLTVYDRKDPLGFPTRPLFGHPTCMFEQQVDNGWNPAGWHTNYFDPASPGFQRAIELIAANC